MFGLLIIDEDPLLSMTGGRTVAHFKLVWLFDFSPLCVFKLLKLAWLLLIKREQDGGFVYKSKLLARGGGKLVLINGDSK